MNKGKFYACHPLIFYHRARNLLADLCYFILGPTVPNMVGTPFLIISGGSGDRSLSGDCSRSLLKLHMLKIVDTGLPVSSRT